MKMIIEMDAWENYLLSYAKFQVNILKLFLSYADDVTLVSDLVSELGKGWLIEMLLI